MSHMNAQLAMSPAAHSMRLPLPALKESRASNAVSSTSAASRRLRAVPGVMRLRAIRRGERVTDFMWEFISASTVTLLGCDPVGLRGKCMGEVAVGPLSHPALIARYRRVIEHGEAQSYEQVHLVDGMQDLVLHRVMPLCDADGVAVTLTNLSAHQRACRAQRASPERAAIVLEHSNVI